MSKLSVSNIGFDNYKILDCAQKFRDMGIRGIEIAPTKIWGVIENSKFQKMRTLKRQLNDLGVEVSGIQSLFFGLPDLQILDRSFWPKIRRHMLLMFEVSQLLGSEILVFGSPKNRIRGELIQLVADQIATEFFQSLLIDLDSYDLRIALEPNAAEYGADYLTTYSEVVRLEQMIGSDRIGVQIDTGCLELAQINCVEAVYSRDPIHVHISAPKLVSPVTIRLNFEEINVALARIKFDGWTVLEMLEPSEVDSVSILDSAQWFANTFNHGSMRTL
jgi:D-psicose/D-tagatose/L-ribulose 3-epimerase